MEKVRLENQTLQIELGEVSAKEECLRQELTVTRHELNTLQTERLQTNPTGSVDSLQNIIDDDRLVAEKQRNRQSYSGDSSATGEWVNTCRSRCMCLCLGLEIFFLNIKCSTGHYTYIHVYE